MSAMTVLDVGSATGFFAFEFERRGARVVSVELPSLRALDCFPGREDDLSWWVPNKSCLINMRNELRFPHLKEVGWRSGVLRPGGHPFNRAMQPARI